MNLGDFSEPQPDLMLLKPRTDYYASGIAEAEDVLLLVEVSDSSLAFDRGATESVSPLAFPVLEFAARDLLVAT